MEIIITNTYSTKPLTHFMHKDASFAMNTGVLLRPVTADNIPRLFYHLNWFFSQLPEARQLAIYRLYERAEALLRPSEDGLITADMPSVTTDLREVIAELMEQMPAEELFQWIRPMSVYQWPGPTELPRAYEDAGSTRYPRDKTYIFEEYQKLFTLIMQLRAVVPIWSAYLTKYPEAFSTDYRDMILIGLLNESSFDDQESVSRLRVYVDSWVGGKTETMEAGVMSGISSDEYPRWLLCDVMVRKLSIQGFDSPITDDKSPFVIKHLSNHIRDRLDKNDMKFNNPERKRIIKESSGPSDEQRSVYEDNRVKQAIGNGERWLMQVYCEDPKRLLHSLEPKIDPVLASSIFDGFNFGEYIPSDEQLLIAMWVNSPSISPRAEEDLTRLNAAMVCAVATAVLWHRGHYAVAAFISSHRDQPITRAGMINPSSIRYSKDIYPELERIYPYGDKMKNVLPVRTVVSNIVVEAEKYLWKPKLPLALIKQLRQPSADANNASHMFMGEDDNPVMQVQQSLAVSLMLAVIDLADRPLPMAAWDKATAMARDMGLPEVPTPWVTRKPVHRSFK